MRTIVLILLCMGSMTAGVPTMSHTCSAEQLQVSTDFEGGSARILEIDPNESVIHFMPGGDSDRGWGCWWAMKVSQLKPGQRLVLMLSPSDQRTRHDGHVSTKSLDAGWSMPLHASVSDDGEVWHHSPAGQRTGNQMRYEVTARSSTLWVAWGPPFTPRHANQMLQFATDRIPGASRFELARTRQGRRVDGLRIQSANAVTQQAGVWIQARQHAWESGSSWVAQGLIDWLAQQGESARWLTDNAELVIVPIMDIDNVATGNGGKEANPRDHNRDWDDAPVYPEVAAAQRHLSSWADDDRLDLFIDLHNPAPKDARPFFFCGPPELLSDVGRDNRALFLGIAQRHINGPLAVEPAPRITGPSYHPLWRQISGQWVNDHGNPHTHAICLETPWNTPHSTTEGYRRVGAQLGETITEYLKRRAKPD